MSGVPVSQSMPTLLEREAPLTVLRDAFADALTGRGRLVLLGGEAGVGKTALLRAFCEEARPRARILVGACDPLVTPRPLGPIVDISAETGGELERRTSEESGASAVLGALMDELRGRPTVLVMEDLHWADEATLDLLRLLGRRVENTRSVIVASFRDDELDTPHPLRLVLGGLATGHAVTRIHLEPLSLPAVRVLAVLREVDADELHRRTGGNPFFVTEVLASPDSDLPETVRDAVLARVAGLRAATRRLIEAVAIVPGETELWLLERVAADDARELADGVASGVLVEHGARIRFRHELARAAVESAIDPVRRRVLHRAILAALADAPAGRRDHARLAHHAEAAGDETAVLLHAVAAARDAAARNAHRQAAEQYARALRFASGLPDAERAALHDARMNECHLTQQVEEALAEGTTALAIYRRLGDHRREGDLLCRMARLHYDAGRADEARATVAAAITLLESLPPGRELARAYGAVAHMAQLDLDCETARRLADEASELGEQLGEPELVADAQTTAGLAEAIVGGPLDRLHRSLAFALHHTLPEQAARAYGALVFASVRRRALADAERWLEEGLQHAAEHDLDGSLLYLLGWRASVSLARGRWDDAATDARRALAHPGAQLTRVWALLVLARLRARRGDPDPWSLLEEARLLTLHDTPQKLVPMRLVAVEAAFLEGDLERARSEAGPLAVAELVDPWIAGELAVWRGRLDFPPEQTATLPDPFALELQGAHEAAAERWLVLDCPFEAGLVLAECAAEGPLRRAHDLFSQLGSRPAAALVARRLRERGATGVARGPRKATTANAASLTVRELEVLGLLAEGLRNSEIAERLHLSPRTVDHHVSAILRKLDASSRGEAVAAAGRLQLLQDR